MRLDLFLPFLRKPKKGATPPRQSLLLRGARGVLPAGWFADPAAGKPGLVRKLLKWLGPTWLSSPWPRLAQTLFFLLFLWLFFYVAWPYTARPDPNRRPEVWPSHYADSLAAKEKIHAETLLILDPLVAVSTAIAARTWVWSLLFAALILVVGVLVPRGFCGYICPL